MHIIAASQHTFIQGSNDSLAKADERPGITTSFTYDYWLDTTEVTQKDYYDITGKKPVSDTSRYGVGDDYPIYNVTWYDAILFCNAKSKKMGLDTVYSYFGLDTGSNNVYSIATVIINYSKDGFRLPTESEWEYAAREGKSNIPFPHQSTLNDAKNYSWFSANSNNATQPVALLKANAFGLYDMAGNVFEWTNDYKTAYCKDSIVNSLGGQGNGDSTIKVIKGGAFNSQLYGQNSIRPSGRSALYPTLLSTTAEYIGFRCARGIIASGNYITTNAKVDTTNASYLATTSIQKLFGTARVKLVYVNITQNKHTLCAIDFSLSNAITECKDSTDVYLPAVSPNGCLIAYCTRDIGTSGNSHIFIRRFSSLLSPPIRLPVDSAFAPKWWVAPSSNDTFLIYTNSATDNASTLWPLTQTFMIKMNGAAASGAPQTLATNGSFYGGRSADGTYIVTGYKNLLLYNLINNSMQHLFTYPHNGKSQEASDQVCNVSISPDTNAAGTSLFLDFGYSGISSITGCSYGVHQYMFTVNNADSITGWYHCPTNEESWDNPRWSNIGRFSVACGCNAAGNKHALYIVDMTSGISTHIIEGTELAQPCLWIDPTQIYNPDNLCIDSLGQYNVEHYTSIQAQLAYKIHFFWQKHNELEIVCTGDSRGADGFDLSRIIGYKAYNLCVVGGDFNGAVVMAQDYVFNHCPKIKMVVMSVVWETFCIDDVGSNSAFDCGFARSYGYQYDKNHNFWQNNLPANFDSLMCNASYPDRNTMGGAPIDEYGHNIFECPSSSWSAVPLCAVDTAWDTANASFKNNFSILKKLVNQAAARGVHILLVNCPSNSRYGQLPYYSYFGPSQKTAHEIIEMFRLLEQQNSYFHLYDANNFGNHPYTSNEFVDDTHLCQAGAFHFSDSLNTHVHSILTR